MYLGKVCGSRAQRKAIGQSSKSVGHLHMVDMHKEEVQMGMQSRKRMGWQETLSY